MVYFCFLFLVLYLYECTNFALQNINDVIARGERTEKQFLGGDKSALTYLYFFFFFFGLIFFYK